MLKAQAATRLLSKLSGRAGNGCGLLTEKSCVLSARPAANIRDGPDVRHRFSGTEC